MQLSGYGCMVVGEARDGPELGTGDGGQRGEVETVDEERDTVENLYVGEKLSNHVGYVIVRSPTVRSSPAVRRVGIDHMVVLTSKVTPNLRCETQKGKRGNNISNLVPSLFVKVSTV